MYVCGPLYFCSRPGKCRVWADFFVLLPSKCMCFFVKKMLIYSAASDLSCSLWNLRRSLQHASSSLWHVGWSPWPGSEPRPPALRVWSLSHWTTRGVPRRGNVNAHRDSTVSSQREREASGETKPIHTFILGFQPPELWEKICVV